VVRVQQPERRVGNHLHRDDALADRLLVTPSTEWPVPLRDQPFGPDIRFRHREQE